MIRALVTKELREVALLAALALVVELAIVSNLIGMKLFTWLIFVPTHPTPLPFVEQGFTSFIAVTGAILALALGFRQSYWETFRGTTLFLFHRPVSRTTILSIKLLTGLVLAMAVTALPILLYAGWAAADGTHAGPFEWSMTTPTWNLWSALPLVYLGAFASGIREARWFGSKLFPLIPACALVPLLQIIPWWWPLGFPIVCLLSLGYIGFITGIAAERDY